MGGAESAPQLYVDSGPHPRLSVLQWLDQSHKEGNISVVWPLIDMTARQSPAIHTIVPSDIPGGF